MASTKAQTLLLAQGTAKAHRQQSSVMASETIHVTPLMPMAGLINATYYERKYSPRTLQDQFELGTMLAEKNPFFAPVLKIKNQWFSDGVGLLGDYPNSGLEEWHNTVKDAGFNLSQMVRNVMIEYLSKNNVAAIWFKADAEAKVVPTLAIVDCEQATFTDAYGMETLKLKTVKNDQLDSATAARIGPKWAAAIKEGKEVELSKAAGDLFRVMSDAKTGKGFKAPDIVQLTMEFGIMELLAVADWAGAYTHGNVIRIALKGHEIKQGDRAGLTDHFMTNPNQKKIREALKSKRGAFDLISNFDFSLLYSYLDPKFFDVVKYKATLEKMERWAGGAGVLLKGGEMKDGVMKSLQIEGGWIRKRVADFLEPILNSPTFWPAGMAPTDRLKLGFNPNTFLDAKFLNDTMRLGHMQGWLSPQTARGFMGWDEARESANLKLAHAKPDQYSPAFQSHQGADSSPGGRPSDAPNTQTPPTAPRDGEGE